MVLEVLSKFNFLDYIILIVFLRICYIAAKMGLSVEIFKFLGVIFSIYIALHYYTGISDIIQRRFLPKVMPLEFVDFIFFVLFIVLGHLCFLGLRVVFSRFIQLDAIPKINQFLGLVLGFGRGILIVGLLSFALAISSIAYFRSSVKHSYLGSKAFIVLPQTYNWLWNNIFSKFSAQEKINPMVAEITEKFGLK